MKILRQDKIRRIKESKNKGGLLLKEQGKSMDINDYSSTEISEMVYGFYKDKKVIITDGDYAVELKKIKGIICELQTVTYFKKPTLADYKSNIHNTLKNIRTFYIKGYYLISDEEIYGNKKHEITRLLWKAGAYRQGTNNFRDLYSIKNDYQVTQQFTKGKFPKDLFHPIKIFINGLFFGDDYKIVNFYVESPFEIL